MSFSFGLLTLRKCILFKSGNIYSFHRMISADPLPRRRPPLLGAMRLLGAGVSQHSQEIPHYRRKFITIEGNPLLQEEIPYYIRKCLTTEGSRRPRVGRGGILRGWSGMSAAAVVPARAKVEPRPFPSVPFCTAHCSPVYYIILCYSIT